MPDEQRVSEAVSAHGDLLRLTLAEMYLEGLLVRRDALRAARLLEDVGGPLRGEACLLLGRLRRDGIGGLERHPEEAEKLFAEGALLSDACRNECGRPRDFSEESARLLAGALEGEDVEAMYSYGLLHIDGWVTDRGQGGDRSIAVEYLRKAADRGHVKSMVALANLLRDGFSDGKKLFWQPEDAVWLYLQAAKSGDVEGMLGLGLMFFDGIGVQQDLDQARSWFARAKEMLDASEEDSPLVQVRRAMCSGGSLWTDCVVCGAMDLGDARLQIRLARMLTAGSGVPEEARAARHMLGEASGSMEDVVASWQATLDLACAELGTPSQDGAVRTIFSLADHGVAMAMVMAARLLISGTGCGQDIPRAVDLLRRAEAAGNIQAAELLEAAGLA